MASAFKVQFDLEKELYRLVGPGGEEGDVVGIGLPAEVEVGGRKYIAYADWNPDEENEPTVELPVHLLGPEQRMEVETDLDFTGLVEDEEDEDGAAPVEGEEAGEVVEEIEEEAEPGDGRKEEEPA